MKYLDYQTLLGLHITMMRDLMGEPYYGVLNKGLLESALSRPMQAANYESADMFQQAAYLFQGLLMNHGFVQGNKRSAYLSLEWFLSNNGGYKIKASDDEIVDFCVLAENEKWSIKKIEKWLRKNVDY